MVVALTMFLLIAVAAALAGANVQSTGAVDKKPILKMSAPIESSEMRSCGINDYFLEGYQAMGTSFMLCFNGTRSQINCPPPAVFNTDTKKCDNPSLNDGDPYINCGSDEYYVDVFPSDCHKYYECSKGLVIVRECEENDNFDPISLTCLAKDHVNCHRSTSRLPKPPTASHPSCTNGTDFLEVNPFNCHEYYNCSDRKLTIESCYMFFNFDPVTFTCKEKWLVNCSTIALKDAPVPKCGPGDSFQEVYPENCAKYFECSNGVERIKTCSFLQLFDPVTLVCRPRWAVNCMEPSHRALKSNIPPPPPECGPTDSFRDVYPGDCHKYYVCLDGEITIENCTPFRNFDPVTLDCKYIWTVDCGQPSHRTTPSPTTEGTTTIQPTKSPNSASSIYPSILLIVLVTSTFLVRN